MLRAHGLDGEFRVVPFSQQPRNIVAGAIVFIAQEQHEIVTVREVTGGLVLTTDRVETREDAAMLRGELLEVPHDQLVPLEDGIYYVADLIGLTASDESGEALGIVSEVLATGANDVYVISQKGGGELLLPAIPDVVLEIDVPGGSMTVRPLGSTSDKSGDEST